MTIPPPTSPWPRLGLRPLALFALLLALLFVFTLSLALGSVRIPLGDVGLILLGGTPARATWRIIVWNFRLPKALTAVLAGSALAVSGLQMQTLFRNPLAGPFVLGINSGASLGVALVVLGAGAAGSAISGSLSLVGNVGIVLAASMGAAAVLFLVMLVSHRVDTMTLLILGLLFGYATSAVVSILLYFSITEQIQAYLNWTFGTFGKVTWGQMQVMAPTILAAVAVAWLSAKPLNALLLGEAYARTMGLTVRRARFWVITSASLLAGTVTAFCGPIGFIGVAVPHLCRGLFATADHRILVPATILLGGIVALTADIIAQLPGSQVVLPLNSITSLIGAPVVAWVILRRK